MEIFIKKLVLLLAVTGINTFFAGEYSDEKITKDYQNTITRVNKNLQLFGVDTSFLNNEHQPIECHRYADTLPSALLPLTIASDSKIGAIIFINYSHPLQDNKKISADDNKQKLTGYVAYLFHTNQQNLSTDQETLRKQGFPRIDLLTQDIEEKIKDIMLPSVDTKSTVTPQKIEPNYYKYSTFGLLTAFALHSLYTKPKLFTYSIFGLSAAYASHQLYNKKSISLPHLGLSSHFSNFSRFFKN